MFEERLHDVRVRKAGSIKRGPYKRKLTPKKQKDFLQVGSAVISDSADLNLSVNAAET